MQHPGHGHYSPSHAPQGHQPPPFQPPMNQQPPPFQPPVNQPPPAFHPPTMAQPPPFDPSGAARPGPPHLNIFVKNGEKMAKFDVMGKSDPYVRFAAGGRVKETTVQKGTDRPQWNQDLKLDIPVDGQGHPHPLDVALVDHDRIGKDDLMGSVRIDLNELVEGQPKQMSLTFPHVKKHGEISGIVYMTLTPHGFGQRAFAPQPHPHPQTNPHPTPHPHPQPQPHPAPSHPHHPTPSIVPAHQPDFYSEGREAGPYTAPQPPKWRSNQSHPSEGRTAGLTRQQRIRNLESFPQHPDGETMADNYYGHRRAEMLSQGEYPSIAEEMNTMRHFNSGPSSSFYKGFTEEEEFPRNQEHRGRVSGNNYYDTAFKTPSTGMSPEEREVAALRSEIAELKAALLWGGPVSGQGSPMASKGDASPDIQDMLIAELQKELEALKMQNGSTELRNQTDMVPMKMQLNKLHVQLERANTQLERMHANKRGEIPIDTYGDRRRIGAMGSPIIVREDGW